MQAYLGVWVTRWGQSTMACIVTMSCEHYKKQLRRAVPKDASNACVVERLSCNEGRYPRPCGVRRAARRGGHADVAVQAQRAGNIPADSATMFPNIWKWKKPGYEDVCSEYVQSLPQADQANVDFPNKAGYYEAGSTPPFSTL